MNEKINTNDAAWHEATLIIEDLLKSGDPAIFAAARDEHGHVDKVKLAEAMLRATARVADKIRAGEI